MPVEPVKVLAARRTDDLQLHQILGILGGDTENGAGLLEFEFVTGFVSKA